MEYGGDFQVQNSQNDMFHNDWNPLDYRNLEEEGSKNSKAKKTFRPIKKKQLNSKKP